MHRILKTFYSLFALDTDQDVRPLKPLAATPMTKNSSLSHRVTSDLRRDIVAGVHRAGRVAQDRRACRALRGERQPGARGPVAAPGRGLRRRQSQPGRAGARRRRRFHPQHLRDSRGDRADLRAPLLSSGDARRSRPSARPQRRPSPRWLLDRPSDFEALEAANRDFHAIILEGEFNIPAIEAMERYAGIINATRAKLPVTLSRLRQRIAQHREHHRSDRGGRRSRRPRGSAIEHVRGAGEDLLSLMRLARTNVVREAKLAEAARGARNATPESAT